MKECCKDNLAPIYDIRSGDYAIESPLGMSKVGIHNRKVCNSEPERRSGLHQEFVEGQVCDLDIETSHPVYQPLPRSSRADHRKLVRRLKVA